MEFWRFIGSDSSLGPELSGSYDPFLVILSIAIACLGGFAALSVGDRVRGTSRTLTKRAWMIAGAIARNTMEDEYTTLGVVASVVGLVCLLAFLKAR